MRALLALVCLLGVAAPATAQQATPFDIAGSYSFLNDSDVEENFHGWLFSATGYLTPWLGVVGEIGRNTASFSSEEFDFDVDGNVFAYGGGVKFAGRASPNATVFAQVVAGVARLSVSGLGESESTTEFMLQPGAGVDLYFSRNVGVRIGGDYRRILVDLQDGLDEFRFHAGIVIGRR